MKIQTYEISGEWRPEKELQLSNIVKEEDVHDNDLLHKSNRLMIVNKILELPLFNDIKEMIKEYTQNGQTTQ